MFFFFSSRRRHTRLTCDWSSDVCSSDLADQRAGDGDALPLAARQLIGTMADAVREPESLQQLERARPPLRARHTAAILQRQGDILFDGQARHQVERLKHE